MRLLNLFLITLLCIAIPLQGIASMVVTKTPCPAEAVDMASMDTDHEHSCCNDADTVAKTGKPCKAEQDCQTASPGLIDQADNPLSAAIGSHHSLLNSRSALSFDPSATWRPPNPV